MEPVERKFSPSLFFPWSAEQALGAGFIEAPLPYKPYSVPHENEAAVANKKSISKTPLFVYRYTKSHIEVRHYSTGTVLKTLTCSALFRRENMQLWEVQVAYFFGSVFLVCVGGRDDDRSSATLLLFDFLARYQSLSIDQIDAVPHNGNSGSVSNALFIDTLSNSISYGKTLLKFKYAKGKELSFIKGSAIEYQNITRKIGDIAFRLRHDYLEILQRFETLLCKVPLASLGLTNTTTSFSICGFYELEISFVIVIENGVECLVIQFSPQSNSSCVLFRQPITGKLKPYSSFIITNSLNTQLYLLYFHQIVSIPMELDYSRQDVGRELTIANFVLNDSVLQYFVKSSNADYILQKKKAHGGVLLIEKLLSCFGLDAESFYPPRSSSQLAQLVDLILMNDDFGDIEKQCILYYLIRQSAVDVSHFLKFSAFPVAYQKLIDGYVAFDNMKYDECLSNIAESGLEFDWGDIILSQFAKATTSTAVHLLIDLTGHRVGFDQKLSILLADKNPSPFKLKQALDMCRNFQFEEDYELFFKGAITPDYASAIMNLNFNEDEALFCQQYCLKNSQDLFLKRFLVAFFVNRNKFPEAARVASSYNLMEEKKLLDGIARVDPNACDTTDRALSFRKRSDQKHPGSNSFEVPPVRKFVYRNDYDPSHFGPLDLEKLDLSPFSKTKKDHTLKKRHDLLDEDSPKPLLQSSLRKIHRTESAIENSPRTWLSSINQLLPWSEKRGRTRSDEKNQTRTSPLGLTSKKLRFGDEVDGSNLEQPASPSPTRRVSPVRVEIPSPTREALEPTSSGNSTYASPLQNMPVARESARIEQQTPPSAPSRYVSPLKKQSPDKQKASDPNERLNIPVTQTDNAEESIGDAIKASRRSKSPLKRAAAPVHDESHSTDTAHETKMISQQPPPKQPRRQRIVKHSSMDESDTESTAAAQRIMTRSAARRITSIVSEIYNDSPIPQSKQRRQQQLSSSGPSTGTSTPEPKSKQQAPTDSNLRPVTRSRAGKH